MKNNKEYSVETLMVVETDCLHILGMIASYYFTLDIAVFRWIAFIKSFNPKFQRIVEINNLVVDMLSKIRYDGEEKMTNKNEDVGSKCYFASMVKNLILYFSTSLESFVKGLYEDEWFSIIRHLNILVFYISWTNEKFKRIRTKAYDYFL